MSKFIELKRPTETPVGWFIKTNEDKPGWLTIHGDITADVSNLDILYHENETVALLVAAGYYNKHNIKFALEPAVNSENDLKDVNEQQVMKFK